LAADAAQLFVLADLFVNNIVAYIMPFLYRAACPFCCPCCYGEELPPGTDCCTCPARPPTAGPLWPEFELSDEYLKVIFRQFLLFSSMSVFPLVSFVALIANVIEWPLTKYRLIHLSRYLFVLIYEVSAAAGVSMQPLLPFDPGDDVPESRTAPWEGIPR